MNPFIWGLLPIGIGISVGAVIAAPGVLWLAQVVLFYMGQRRELYFSQTRSWITLGQYGCAALCYGLSIITYAMRFYTALMEFISGATFVGGVILVTIGPRLLRTFPPRWLADLESNRSEEERAVIHETGRAWLTRCPRKFRQIIRSIEGWEGWLLTVIEPVPLARFDPHVAYVEQALGKHLHRRAREVTEQIIDARPDRALGYQLRARAFLGDYHFSEAVQDYNRCIELEPHNVDFFYCRARVFLMLDQMDCALADLETAYALEPDNERLRDLRDIAARRQRQLREKSPPGV